MTADSRCTGLSILILSVAAGALLACGPPSPERTDRHPMLDAVERAESLEEQEALLVRFEGMRAEVDRSPALLRAEVVLRRGVGDWQGAAERLESYAGHATTIQEFERALDDALRHLVDLENWPGARRLTEQLGAPVDVDSTRLVAIWAMSATTDEARLASRSFLSEALSAQPGDPWLLAGLAVSDWRANHWGPAYLAAEAALAAGVDMDGLVPTVRASALAHLRPGEAQVLFDALPETPLTVRHRALQRVHRVQPHEGLALLHDWLARHPRDSAATALARALSRMVEKMPTRDDESEP